MGKLNKHANVYIYDEQGVRLKYAPGRRVPAARYSRPYARQRVLALSLILFISLFLTSLIFI